MAELSLEQRKWLERSRAELLYARHWQVLGVCGNAIFDNKLITYGPHDAFNRYVFTSRLGPLLPQGKCLIGDFGSGNGFLSNKICGQLRQAREGCVASSVGIDIIHETVWRNEERKFYIPIIQGDLKNIPVRDKTFHAGLSRFVLGFIPKEDQGRVLREFYRTLKPGAPFVIFNYGGFTESAADLAWNRLFAETAKYEGLHNMHYPSCERLARMATEEAHFNVLHQEDLTDLAFAYFTPQTAAQGLCRKLSQAQKRQKRQELKDLFQGYKNDGVLAFEPPELRPQSLRTPLRMFVLVLQKPLA